LDSFLGKKENLKEAKQGLEAFFCKQHKIYLTPTTFIYEDFSNNLLWYDDEDKELLEKILKMKRVKAQLHHDNSEDAVTWNVFRFLERNNLIEGFLSYIIGKRLKSSEVIYWSYSQKQDGTWSLLAKARKKFGEKEQRGSEPDIIIITDKALTFVEAKLTAGNETTPSNTSNSKKYETEGNSWFSKVFDSNYVTVAINKKKYELMRFWLLGTWIAEQQHLDFYLINLVLSEREPCIEEIFKQHIKENERRYFRRITWESIYEYISNKSSSRENDTILGFFRSQLPPTISRGLGIRLKSAEVKIHPVFATSDLVVHFPSFLKRGQGRLKSPLIPLY
jgi:hypothetical protein